MLGSRSVEAGEEASSLRDLGIDVLSVQLDLNFPETIDAAINEIGNKGYFVDVLINNAVVLYEATLLNLTDSQIAETTSVHLSEPLQLIRLLVPNMISPGYGRIVNISSGWGAFAEGMGGTGVYGITKAALNALKVRLAKELPSTVKVNAMCPGWVRTPMSKGGLRTKLRSLLYGLQRYLLVGRPVVFSGIESQ